MINVLVELKVKDFDALHAFEVYATNIMVDHQGRVIAAFETERNLDGSGEEIHILEFPEMEAFENYRKDKRLSEYSELRQKAISDTTLKISTAVKSYF